MRPNHLNIQGYSGFDAFLMPLLPKRWRAIRAAKKLLRKYGGAEGFSLPDGEDERYRILRMPCAARHPFYFRLNGKHYQLGPLDEVVREAAESEAALRAKAEKYLSDEQREALGEKTEASGS